MTKAERGKPDLLKHSRKKRIAKPAPARMPPRSTSC
jgi:signal recognition particle GTPase